MSVIVADDRLLELVDPEVQVDKLAGGCVFTEGPVWNSRERFLIFSDIYDDKGGTTYRWSEKDGTTVVRRPSNRANGSTYDRQGRLITCEHGRRVVITRMDGTAEPLIENFGSARLNSPNDVICDPEGNLIFTDPVYGLRQPDGSIAGQEYPFSGVFRYSMKDGSLTPLVEDVGGPNGLAIPDDGSRLYVCDTPGQKVHVWDRDAAGTLSNRRVFCETKYGEHQGRPDGMKLDSLGNVYIAGNSPGGIWVYNAEGVLLGLIGVGEEMNRQGTAPGGPANLAWGGDDWRTMYATAVSSVYRLRMKVAGQPVRMS